ncbi:g_PROTEIN_RECEP_F1_2 domain-containing protein [Caerostris extrusa]|uniref:G_PROTEIN_RECEP_F1_2 domain-containing protein n=1 Tax=Caerostris extrusa TaxID=172846 RepID=A0AAV4NTE8_CAEEX|nr:g_PROTEIN_RECEP_F1_2 domain-containing protein [Caerostris extrusa]
MGPFSHCYVLVLEAFRLGGMVVAVFHLLALAINHFIGILRPLHYASTVTRGTVAWAIACMWIVPSRILSSIFLLLYQMMAFDLLTVPATTFYYAYHFD